MRYASEGPHKRTNRNMSVFMSKECMAQLDLTANIVLPASPPLPRGNPCHGNSDGHSSLQTWPVWKELKGQQKMKRWANKHPRRLRKLYRRRTCPVTQENKKKHQRGCLFLSALLISPSSRLPSPSTLYPHDSYKQPPATQTCSQR